MVAAAAILLAGMLAGSGAVAATRVFSEELPVGLAFSITSVAAADFVSQEDTMSVATKAAVTVRTEVRNEYIREEAPKG
jgi:hypothetical protein